MENRMRAEYPIMIVTCLLLLAFTPFTLSGMESGRTFVREAAMFDDLEVTVPMVLENQNIVVSGNVTIRGNASLYLINCSLRFNNTGDGSRGILIEKGGFIELSNGTYLGTNSETEDRFFFVSYGNVSLKECRIENVSGGVRDDVDGWGGIEVHNANLNMKGATLSNFRSNGLFLNGTEAHISDSAFINCGDDAVESIDTTLNVTSCIFQNNNFGIYGSNTSLRVENSRFTGTDFPMSFGIKIWGGSLHASGLDIRDFGRYGMVLDRAEVFVKDSWVENNGVMNEYSKGIYLNKCSSRIENVTSIHHGHSGLYAKHSVATFENCQVWGNRFYNNSHGIRVFEGDVSIINSNISNCSGYGIRINNSGVEISGNLVENITGVTDNSAMRLDNCQGNIRANRILNYGDIGIGLVNSSMTIKENVIDGGSYIYYSSERKVGILLEFSDADMDGNTISNSINCVRGYNSYIILSNNSVHDCVKGVYLEEGSSGTMENITSKRSKLMGIGLFESSFSMNNVDCDSILIRGCDPTISNSTFNEISGLSGSAPTFINCFFEKVSFNTNCNVKIIDPVNHHPVIDISRYSSVSVVKTLRGIVYSRNHSKLEGARVSLISINDVSNRVTITDKYGLFEVLELPVATYNASGYGNDYSILNFYPYYIEVIDDGEWFGGYLDDISMNDIVIILDNISINGTLNDFTVIEAHPDPVCFAEKGETVTFAVVPSAVRITDIKASWFVDGYPEYTGSSFFFELDTRSLSIGSHIVECRITRTNNKSSDDLIYRRWVLEVHENEPEYSDDSDLDGLPDIWEYYHFGGLHPRGGDDPDQDGYSNYEEYRMDTDPNVANENNDRENNPSGIDMGTLLILTGSFYFILVIIVIGVVVYHHQTHSDDKME